MVDEAIAVFPTTSVPFLHLRSTDFQPQPVWRFKVLDTVRFVPPNFSFSIYAPLLLLLFTSVPTFIFPRPAFVYRKEQCGPWYVFFMQKYFIFSIYDTELCNVHFTSMFIITLFNSPVQTFPLGVIFADPFSSLSGYISFITHVGFLLSPPSRFNYLCMSSASSFQPRFASVVFKF